MSEWLVVAKNEYRLVTSSFRSIRRYFPYLALGLLLAWVAFLAPAIISSMTSEVLAFFLSQAAAGMVQVTFFMFFLFFLTFPISLALREVKAEEQEIFLSAPIKASNILLGKFIGQTPIYAIVIALIMGFFTALLKPLGLDFFQMGISVVVSIITFLSALWIGIVFTAILRTKLGRSSRGKDIGKAVSMIIVLPVVALIYALLSGSMLKALSNPNTSGTVKSMISWLPSSWASEMITDFAANPGNLAAEGLQTLTRFGALLFFFIAVLWLGTKAASRAYSLETSSFTSSRIKPDGTFYRTIRQMGGGKSFGVLLVSTFKDYSRRFQNLSRIAYIIGILILVNIFFVEAKDPTGSLMMAQMMLPVVAAFVVGEVTIRGKENLFIYRKCPYGEGKVVRARLLHGWLVVVPIAAFLAIGSLLRTHQTELLSFIAYTGLIMIVAMANVTFALGLFLLIPAYSEKGEFMLNIMILSMSAVSIFIISQSILKHIGIKSLYYTQLLHILLSWLVAFIILYLGKKNLSRIE